MLNRFAIGVSTLMVLSGTSLGGVSDFYVSTYRGSLYLVDGDTLEATRVGTLPERGGHRDAGIAYLGGGALAVGTLNTIERYDIGSGLSSTLVSYESAPEIPGIRVSPTFGELTRRSDGSLYTIHRSVVPGEGLMYYGSLIGASGQFLSTERISFLDGYEDFAFLDETRLLVVGDNSISTVDIVSGETHLLSSFRVPGVFLPSSVEVINGEIRMMSVYGELFSYDLDSGATQSLGIISGVPEDEAYYYSMTVPAPGAALLLGMGGLIGVRRRR